MQQPAFIGPSYTLSSVNVDAQRSVNLMPELNELGTGKNREVASLVSTPGLRRLSSVGQGPCRGFHKASNGTAYAVIGAQLRQLSIFGLPETIRGTIATSSGTVSMADNGQQLILVDGGKGYIMSLATFAFAEITDTEFPDGATSVGFIDGYFVVNRPNSQQFQISHFMTALPGMDWT